MFLRKVLVHHVLPEQLQCTLALILLASSTLLEGLRTILEKYVPSSSVCTMVESVV